MLGRNGAAAIHQAAEDDLAAHGATAIPRARAMAAWTRRRGPRVVAGLPPVVRGAGERTANFASKVRI